ncbi:MAG: hypothetical protein H0V22_08385 [Solirubrobacterales bacterium]|nr:hypothetical protein [Solirubrobacterales bacterium]
MLARFGFCMPINCGTPGMAVDVFGMPVVGLCRGALDHPDHLKALTRWEAPAPGSQRTPDLLVTAAPDTVERVDEALAAAGLERDRGDRMSFSTGDNVATRDRPVYRYRSPEIGGRLLRGSHGVTLATFSAGRASLTLPQPAHIDIGRGHTIRIVVRELPLPMPLTDAVARLVGGDNAQAADGVLVSFVFFGEWMLDIAVPSANEALDAWASDHSVAYEISQPGRYAGSLLGRLDSLDRLDALASDVPVRILDKLTPVSRLRLARRLADELRPEHDLDETALAERLRGQELGLDLPARRAADFAGEGTRLPDILAAMVPLLDAGYVRRGRSLRCPLCKYSLWFALDEMAEQVRCEACRASFTLPVAAANGREAPLEFRLDGLTARAMDQGLLPVLLAVRAIRRTFAGYEVRVWPGIEFERGDKKVDVDVLAYGAWLLCCEVKTHADGLERNQLNELLELCDAIEARPGLAALDGEFSAEDIDAVIRRGGVVLHRAQLLN